MALQKLPDYLLWPVSAYPLKRNPPARENIKKKQTMSSIISRPAHTHKFSITYVVKFFNKFVYFFFSFLDALASLKSILFTHSVIFSDY